MEAELQALLERKLEAEKNLAVIESKIYALETSYLNEIKDPGSVVRGYAKLLPPSQTSTPTNELAIPMQTDAMDISMDHLKVVEEDAVEDLDPYRIFSSSSFTTDAVRFKFFFLSVDLVIFLANLFRVLVESDGFPNIYSKQFSRLLENSLQSKLSNYLWDALSSQTAFVSARICFISTFATRWTE